MPILALLCTLPAKSTLSLAMYPQKKIYALSLTQQNPNSEFSGKLTFSEADKLVMVLPSRFKIKAGTSLISMGYAGFWGEYALLPTIATKEQALLVQGRKNACAVLMGKSKWAVGYERATEIGSLSALAWIQSREDPSTFQTEWAPDSSLWGVVGKALFLSRYIDVSLEMLLTPILGLDGFVSGVCTYGPTSLGFAYGQAPYPSRYSLSFELGSNAVHVTFRMEDWFGSKPIYGGFSAPRKRRQSSEVEVFLGKRYLQFCFSDTYEFTKKGIEAGSVSMKATWGGSFGKVSAQYGVSRHPMLPEKVQYSLSLVLYKASLSYTENGYEATLTDSIVMGKGTLTWALAKRMGEAVSLALFYAITSAR